MSLREKSAWISFLTVLIAAAIFFGANALGWVSGFTSLHLLVVCVAAVILLQLALHALAAWRSPRDARSLRDEREHAILLRSFRVGYYVLVVGVLAMFVTGHATFSVSLVLYHALAALTLSTLSISLTQIVLFRLGR